MTRVPPAPWQLQGQAIGFLASPFQVRLLVNYGVSPVGPYLEHAIARLTLTGPTITQMSVTSEASMVGGRTLWGFPKVLEELEWPALQGRIEFRRGAERFYIRPLGPALPVKMRAFTWQNLNGRKVKVPCRMSGKWRPAFHGRQFAIYLESFELTVESPVFSGS